MFGTPPARPKAVALFDVGHGSVAAAIAECMPGETPMVIALERAELPIEEREVEHVIASLKTLLVETGSRVLGSYRRAGSMPEDAYAIIRAPWSRSAIMRTNRSFKTEENVSTSLIEELIADARSREEPLLSQYVSSRTMYVSLNGYATLHPEGRRARDIEVAELVCAAHPRMKGSVAEAIDVVLPHAKKHLHAGIEALFEAARVHGAETAERVLVEFGRDGTLFVVVRDGSVARQHFVADGARSMLEKISTAPDETLATLRLWSRNECDADTCASLQAALARIEPVLARAFGEAFSALSDPRRLPDTLVLAAPPDFTPWLGNFFSRIDFSQFTSTRRPFFVEILGSRPGVIATFAAGVEFDAGIATAAALINTAD